MTISGNDDFDVTSNEVENFSDSEVDFRSDDENIFKADFEDLESEFVSEPRFSNDRIDYEAVTLSSDRATGTIDYSGYFENFTVLLIFLLVCNIGFGLVISFLLGVKK